MLGPYLKYCGCMFGDEPGIYYLTPIDLQLLDPTGKARAHLNAYRMAETFEPLDPWFADIDPIELSKCNHSKVNGNHTSYFQYDEQHYSKVGRQGGHYHYNTMLSLIKSSYTYAKVKPKFNASLVGRDYFINYFQQLVDQFGYVKITPRMTDYSTSAGLPFMVPKNSYQAHRYVFGWNVGYHLLPDLPGQRRQRTKNRLIHMDALENVDYLIDLLGAIREYVKEHVPRFFSAWKRPDLEMLDIITKALDANCINAETDCESMDLHYTVDVANEIVLPVITQLLDPVDRQVLVNYVYHQFRQPAFMGDHLRTGLHTLWSGQCPTNDFETYYLVITAVGVSLCLHCLDTVEILANGDDFALLSRAGKSTTDKWLNLWVSELNGAGMIVSHEKSRYNTGDLHFCRKVYYRTAPRDVAGKIIGAYPESLFWNNLKQPERLLYGSDGLKLARVLSMCDNLVGNPDYNIITHIVFKLLVKQGILLHVIEETDLIELMRADWWARLYGESWSPRSSKTFALWLSYLQSRKTR